MVLISIGVVATADARVVGFGRVGGIRGILDVAGEGASRPFRVVGCADVEQGREDPISHFDLAALGWVFGQQHLAAGGGHLEVVVAVGQAGCRLGSIRPGPTVQINLVLAFVMDVLIDDRAVRSGSENGPVQGRT